MPSLPDTIAAAIQRTLPELVGPEGLGVDPLVRATQDPRFGDFQSNVALSAAKRFGRKPRELAESLAALIDRTDATGGACHPTEIAGPGFLNFRARADWLSAQLGALQADPRLGIPPDPHPQRVVVDFSSPNLAKEMHVGTLRTTIIGETICRLLEFLGHDVLRINHVGDWGTQFGMLLQHVRESQPEVLEAPDRFRVDDLEGFYRAAKTRFDSDPAFATAARLAVVELQSGEPVARRLWEAFCRESLRHAHELYGRLDVRIIDRGESFYNDRLGGVVAALQEKGLAVEDQGAICVFPEGWTNKEGERQPFIIRKSDGGYMYATTDLAALRQRIEEEHAQRLIYVTDLRQSQHFQMLFAVARQAGWVPEGVTLQHVGYGMILGPDRLPFKTRSGDTVKLRDLLDEAVARAVARGLSAGEERRPELDAIDRAEVARTVGIGAVKYADLSHHPSSSYVFDWDTMLGMEGNTAPYMQYVYARVRSIGRKAGIDFDQLPADLPLLLEHESEIALAKQLLAFHDVLQETARDLVPHLLTGYLYLLSRAFNTFYDRERGVRVADAEPEAVRLSRLRLCDLTARTVKLGLWFLGIGVVEQM